MFSRIELCILTALTLAATTMMVEARNRVVIEATTAETATPEIPQAQILAQCLTVSPAEDLLLAYAAGFGAMGVSMPDPCQP